MKYRFFYTGIAAFNVVVSAFYHGAAARPMDFENPANSPEIRIADLLSRMTPLEKISQLGNNAPGLPRLGLAAYA